MCRCVPRTRRAPAPRNREKNLTPLLFSPQVEVSQKGVAHVKMDVQGEKQNTFNQEFYEDMEAMVNRIETDEAVKCVVLSSGKAGSWIAGANIKQMEDLKSADEASVLVTKGQSVMNRVAGSYPRLTD